MQNKGNGFLSKLLTCAGITFGDVVSYSPSRELCDEADAVPVLDSRLSCTQPGVTQLILSYFDL